MTIRNVELSFPSNAAAVRATNGRKVSTANSKMPGSSFATNPFQCNVGSKLRDVDGSVCSKCYACRIAKMRPSVAKGYADNEAELRAASALVGEERQQWVAAFADQIRRAAIKTGELYHRWFDAGDLASAEVLQLIVEICQATPEIDHWLPTRELGAIREWIRCYTGRGNVSWLPDNLVVRVSSTMIDDAPRKAWAWTSTVHKHSEAHGHACPAQSQGNTCGDCRACWSRNVSNVSYPVH